MVSGKMQSGREISWQEFCSQLLESGQVDRIMIANKTTARWLQPKQLHAMTKNLLFPQTVLFTLRRISWSHHSTPTVTIMLSMFLMTYVSFCLWRVILRESVSLDDQATSGGAIGDSNSTQNYASSTQNYAPSTQFKSDGKLRRTITFFLSQLSQTLRWKAIVHSVMKI